MCHRHEHGLLVSFDSVIFPESGWVQISSNFVLDSAGVVTFIKCSKIPLLGGSGTR
jgi:hypothetical protein